MSSLFDSALREGCYLPVVHAYYDRADMLHTTSVETEHSHTLCEIMYVNEGSIRVKVPDGSVTVPQRQYIWLDGQVSHRLELSNVACGVMNIEFQMEALDAHCPSLADLYKTSCAMREMLDHPAAYLVQGDADGAIYNLLKQIILLADSAHPESEKLCSTLTTQLLLLIAKGRRAQVETAESPCGSQMAAALAFIEEQYSTSITAKQIAQHAGIAVSALHRLFREQMNMTVREVIMQHRLRQAQVLLAETDDTLLSVATAVGISSQQRFGQMFRQMVGVTPLAYRRNARKEAQKS